MTLDGWERYLADGCAGISGVCIWGVLLYRTCLHWLSDDDRHAYWSNSFPAILEFINKLRMDFLHKTSRAKKECEGKSSETSYFCKHIEIFWLKPEMGEVRLISEWDPNGKCGMPKEALFSAWGSDKPFCTRPSRWLISSPFNWK